MDCPYCTEDISDDMDYSQRWTHYMTCRYCKGHIEVEYDVIYDEDTGEEIDYWYTYKEGNV